MKEKIKTQIVEALNLICLNPSIFVSEMDIHMIFMKELMKIDELNYCKKLYNTNCTIGNRNGKISEKKYQTTLIHKEYGHSNETIKGKSRSDIVILNKDEVNEIDDPINLKRKGKWLTPDYIFEFGSEKSATEKKTFIKHFKGDLEKVTVAKIQGYLIHIHRNYYKSNGKRGLKNKTKYEEYAKTIQEELLKYNKKYIINCKEKPKIVIIKIDLGGTDRPVTNEGKVQILKDPYNNPNCQFEGINLKELKSEFEKLLK